MLLPSSSITSPYPVSGHIDRLVAARALIQVNVGRRNRAFEAPELIGAFTAPERRMSSPLGDTLAFQKTTFATMIRWSCRESCLKCAARAR